MMVVVVPTFTERNERKNRVVSTIVGRFIPSSSPYMR